MNAKTIKMYPKATGTVQCWKCGAFNADSFCHHCKPKATPQVPALAGVTPLGIKQTDNATARPMTETNRTPYKQTHVAKSLEVLNDLGHFICCCEADHMPKALCIGNANHISKVLNEHAALVAVAEAAEALQAAARALIDGGCISNDSIARSFGKDVQGIESALANLAAVQGGAK